MTKSTKLPDFLKNLLYDGCSFEESDGSDVEKDIPVTGAEKVHTDEDNGNGLRGLHPSNGIETSELQTAEDNDVTDDATGDSVGKKHFVEESNTSFENDTNDVIYNFTGGTERKEDFVEETMSGEDDVQKFGWEELDESKMLTLEFDSSDVAYLFYNDYAKMIGFSVRKDHYRKTPDGVGIKRKFVCSCEGLREVKHSSRTERKRPPRRITRTNCRAHFEVKNNGSGKWVVENFFGEHNHNLAPNLSSMFLRSHRRMSDEDKEMARSLNKSGLRKCQIMDYLIQRAGCFFNVGFLKRDLYNFLHRERMEEYSLGDAKTLLILMANKLEKDPSFYYDHETDKDGKLIRLFWADGASRKDYKCFGDVLLFDATYRTNKYKMSFIIFAGVNNHCQTIIFGFSLLSNETVDAYSWVLKTFLKAMGEKPPQSVITDGDKAIRRAVKNMLPTSRHRLCSWHLAYNCSSNVHNTGFVIQFHILMNKNSSIEEFDEKWDKLIKEFNVENNNWVMTISKKRGRWAEAYLRDSFFAGCRSNQRCKSMNSMVRHYVDSGMRLFELYHKMEWAVEKIRHREHESEVISSVSRPFIDSHLVDIANHAASVYTKASFNVFHKQLGMEVLYIVEGVPEKNDSHNTLFTLSRYKNGHRKWKVKYNVNEQILKCSCGLLESYGFPCRHMIAVLKHQHIDRLPLSCILLRWTRHVKSAIPDGTRSFVQKSLQTSLLKSELMNETKKLCFWGSQSTENCQEVKNLISSFLKSKDFPSRSESNSLSKEVGNRSNALPTEFEFIQDPPEVNSKGRQKNKRIKGHLERKSKSCSHCHLTGHTNPTCPTRKGKADGPIINRQQLKKRDRDVEVENDVLVDHELPPPRTESEIAVDPKVVQKGPKRKSKCGLCGVLGHNRARCLNESGIHKNDVGIEGTSSRVSNTRVDDTFGLEEFGYEQGERLFRIID